MDNQIYIPPEGPPRDSAPPLFDKIGLERLYEMAWIQYRLFRDTPIFPMFPQDEEGLKQASEKQAEFLCGLLGGPKIYLQKYGHPRMRARHLPFPIDREARDQWLACFEKAFAQCGGLGLDETERASLLKWIQDFSLWMVNKG